MHDFWTPGLLARAAPEARILVLVRDPWERYVSGLGHETRVLRRELRRGRREYLRAMIASDALSRSLYSRQLSALFEHFDRSQVLVLQYELCVDDPARELRRTYEFLGVDPDHVPASVNRRIGRSSPRIELPDHVAREAAMAIARDALRLGELVPEIELALWPSCRNRHPAGRSEGNGERAAEAALP